MQDIRQGKRGVIGRTILFATASMLMALAGMRLLVIAPTPEQEVETALFDLVRAAEREDVALLLERVAPDYSGWLDSRDNVRNRFEGIIYLYDGIRVHVDDVEIVVEDQEARATLVWSATVGGSAFEQDTETVADLRRDARHGWQVVRSQSRVLANDR